MAQLFPTFKFTHIVNHSQLPSSVCSYAHKDREGFLWISTYGGLVRYDGKNSTVYKPEKDNPYAIAGGLVGMVTEDKEGNIWAYQQSGISCLSAASGKFTNYYPNPKDSTAVLQESVIRVDTSGNIFNTAIDGYGLKIFNKATQKFIPVPVDTTDDGFMNKNNSMSNIGRLSDTQYDGSMYLQSVNGTFLFNTKTFARKRVSNGSSYTPLYLLKDHTGTLWIGEWGGGLSIINEQTKTKRTVIPGIKVYGIVDYQDLDGKHWIVVNNASTSSIIVLDPVTEKYQTQVLKLENEITPNFIAGYMFDDGHSNLYLTSLEGLLVANPVRQQIQNQFTYERGKGADIFYDNLVRSGIQLNDGGYVFGLLEYNGLRFYDSSFSFKKAIKNYRYKGRLYDLDVKNFLRVAPDTYLLSGKTGIARMQNGIITPLYYLPIKFRNTDTAIKEARDLLAIDNENFWVRIRGGNLKLFNVKAARFYKSYDFAGKAKKNPLNGIKTIRYDNGGRLWINSATAVYCYDKATDEFVQQPVTINQKYFPVINSFCFDGHNNLWLTGEGGLLTYNTASGKETFYTTANGLYSNSTLNVTADSHHTIWFTHLTSLDMLNPATGQVKHYTTSDGLPTGLMEYDAAFFTDRSNNLLLGSTGVVSRINIEKLYKVSSPPSKVVITEVTGKDSSITIFTNSLHQQTTALTAENFPVTLHFSIIDFSTNAERNYFYRYAGKDTAWLPCNEGAVPITTTAPGTYTIEVTGQVNGAWAQNTERIRFTILPKWHQTKAFTIAALLLSAGALFLFFKWRINTAKRNERQQTEIEKLSAEQYKNQLELSQVTNYFSSSLIDKNAIDDVLWDVAKNLIGQLGFEDCMIYLWNSDNTKMIQKAGYGPKGSIEEIGKLPFDVVDGQGVVGFVMSTKQPVIIADTTTDTRYRQDEMARLSELCVPVMHNQELIGIIDSEHHQKNFYTQRHLQLLQTIATLIANKIKAIESDQNAQQAAIEIIEMKQQLKSAQLDALRSQMDPHFIFNSLNSIENFILKNERLLASEYLGKFSKLIRNILDNSKNETIPIEQEIDTLKIYIELERLRMNHCFEVTYEIEDDVLESDIRIPPMLMQPYIENAILHGIRLRNDGDGKLLIKIYLCHPDGLCYLVQDNGVGRQRAAVINAEKKLNHQSYGIAITQSRIDIYNQLNKVQVTVSTTDLYHPQTGQSNGTQVEMILPVQNIHHVYRIFN